jgi:hypothetical protein
MSAEKLEEIQNFAKHARTKWLPSVVGHEVEKPCPKCGEIARVEYLPWSVGEGRKHWIVTCMPCDLTTPPHRKKVDALAAWKRG